MLLLRLAGWLLLESQDDFWVGYLLGAALFTNGSECPRPMAFHSASCAACLTARPPASPSGLILVYNILHISSISTDPRFCTNRHSDYSSSLGEHNGNGAPPPGTSPFLRPCVKMPKRRKTSEQVTKMDRTMRTMMIHVMPVRGWCC